LYVVDLERFRQLAAGDSWRIIYDQLSRDPNSLSNLDQDLPNYSQQQVMAPTFRINSAALNIWLTLDRFEFSAFRKSGCGKNFVPKASDA
jgi:hypothetical protein